MTETMERKTVYRWWSVWNFEQEEAWLNQMALQGWVLDGVGFCMFRFVRCEPGEYTVRLEMHASDPAYLDFMQESGAEYVGRCVQWIYFRRKSELGAFDLFSDIDSRISHLERICTTLRLIGFANILIGCANAVHFSSMGIANLLCGCLLMYALGRIRGKEEELKKQRMLHE